jgi:hypothetical protein
VDYELQWIDELRQIRRYRSEKNKVFFTQHSNNNRHQWTFKKYSTVGTFGGRAALYKTVGAPW